MLEIKKICLPVKTACESGLNSDDLKSRFMLLYSHFPTLIQLLLSYKTASLALQDIRYRSAKEAVWKGIGISDAAKYDKNGFRNLYNQFLFCNSFLLFV